MCRLAAYVGPELALHDFLLAPPHSLMVQAWAPQELVYAKLNADGYGFGWFAAGEPATYVNPAPIWSDPNLKTLARALRAPLWLGSIRSATEGNPVNHANTQPFADPELLFTHNGYVSEFHLYVRSQLSRTLNPQILADIRGNTDSEYLFALLRQILADDPELSIEAAIARWCQLLAEWTQERPALLNFLLSEGHRIFAVRFAVNHAAPSLYYSTDNDDFPGAQLVASERMNDSGFWQAVPESNLLVLAPDELPELIEL